MKQILSQYYNLMTPWSTNKEDVLKDARSSKNNTTAKESFKHQILNLREQGKCKKVKKASMFTGSKDILSVSKMSFSSHILL